MYIKQSLYYVTYNKQASERESKARFKQRMAFIIPSNITKNRLSRITHYYRFNPESTHRVDTLAMLCFIAYINIYDFF